MAVIRSSSTYPIALSSRTHSAAKLIAGRNTIAHTARTPEQPAATVKRSQAQRDVQLAKALTRNRYSIFTR
jgi:hypothetical protein